MIKEIFIPYFNMLEDEMERAKQNGDFQKVQTIERIKAQFDEPSIANLPNNNVRKLNMNNVNNPSHSGMKVTSEQLIGVMNRFTRGTEAFWSLYAGISVGYIAKGFTGEQLVDLVLGDIYLAAARLPVNTFNSIAWQQKAA